jgi:hypothetical protein
LAEVERAARCALPEHLAAARGGRRALDGKELEQGQAGLVRQRPHGDGIRAANGQVIGMGRRVGGLRNHTFESNLSKEVLSTISVHDEPDALRGL